MTAVIVAGARTPIGKMGGALSHLSAVDLGATAIAAALDRAGIDPAVLDAVLIGHVVQAGAGPNPARQAAAAGGVPLGVPATTINKLCLSGLTSVALAAEAIAVGRHDILLAGGMESMSAAPFVVAPDPDSPRGPGGEQPLDSLERDALICAFDGVHVGAATDRYQQHTGMTRSEQDRFAARSHALAAAAREMGRFADEIVEVVASDGNRVTLDEGVRPSVTEERLAALSPVFSSDGTITAGSASQLSDGGCAMVIMRRERADELGLDWLAEIGAYGTSAGPDPSLLGQPAAAVRDALARDGALTARQVDCFEINEAFAGVPLTAIRELGIPGEIVNVNGGAIALGHPVGMSGARLVLTLAMELRRRGGGTGVAALCGGGGQGDAMVLRVPAAAA